MNETLSAESFTAELPIPAVPKGKAEYHAFLKLLPQLLKTHPGQFVAVHNGQVVDTDADEVALILRVRAHLGAVPIHVGQVIDPQPVGRIPHYREYRPILFREFLK